jgi:hypothetical protein
VNTFVYAQSISEIKYPVPFQLHTSLVFNEATAVGYVSFETDNRTLVRYKHRCNLSVSHLVAATSENAASKRKANRADRVISHF